MTYYVPGTEEKDPAKVIVSLQQAHQKTATNTTDIATNTAAIAALNAAGYVVGPASATANGFAVYSGTTGKLIKDHAATISLTSEVSNTLPVANGGTNYTGGAWTTYTPTITALAGTFTTTSAAGSFLTIGKLVHFTVTITITTVGTASGAVLMTLPVGTPLRPFAVSGAETALTGKAIKGVTAASGSTSQIGFYDNGFPGASGNVLTLTGIYELT